MGRRSGIASIAALGVMLALGACASGPATTAPPAEERYEGSDAPWETARRAGATFRASGNEPGWTVEVYPDSLVFVTSYGQERYRFESYTTSNPDAEPFVYEASADGRTISVARADTPCRDDMSGQPFETTVRLTFDGQPYRGCGRALD